jgi:hypothetical protein
MIDAPLRQLATYITLCRRVDRIAAGRRGKLAAALPVRGAFVRSNRSNRHGVRFASSQVNWDKLRTKRRDSPVRTGYKRLDFERFSIAFRVLALAGQFGCLLAIGTCFAAVILSGRSRTVASRVFAFLCRGHESSFCLNMPSHFRRLCCPLRQLHTGRCNYLFRFAQFAKYGPTIRWTFRFSRTCAKPHRFHISAEGYSLGALPLRGGDRHVNFARRASHPGSGDSLQQLSVCGEFKQQDDERPETLPPRSSTTPIASTTPKEMVLDRLDDFLG